MLQHILHTCNICCNFAGEKDTNSKHTSDLGYYRLITIVAISLLIAIKAICASDTNGKRPILIVTSYNPDTRTVADNLRAFTDQYEARGGQAQIAVEYLNCRNMPEATEWKGRMERILTKYSNPDNKPLLVITLGIEAGAAYLMLDSEAAKKTPVLMGMRSTCNIDLPTDTTDIYNWQPQSKDIRTDYPDFNIVGGVLYDYDLTKNIELMRTMFPQTRKIHFISDNTLGGVNMQAFVRQEAKRANIDDIDFIDGRHNTFSSVYNKVEAMHSEDAVLIGTWRIDSLDNYVLGNTTIDLCKVNPHLAVSTMASVGLGTWAMGGYCPKYRIVGNSLADIAVDFLKGELHGKNFEIVDNEYVYDYNRLRSHDIELSTLPKGEVINRPQSFMEKYHTLVYVAGIFILVLVVGLIISFIYIIKIKSMTRMLETRSKELEEARDKAEEANRLKNAFLANLSHEVRTPLNAIVGFTGLLLDGEEDLTARERNEFATIINSNSDILLKIINDMLEISQLDANSVSYHYESCDLNEICHSQLTAMARIAKNDKVDYHFHTDLPDKFNIEADTVRLRQLVGNLLSNATKFTEHGYILLTTAPTADKGMIEIRVEDSGIGVPADKAEKIFERFVKLDEFKQGTGIGLSICRKIATAFGGNIWLDQTYKKGARFIVQLPIRHS